jgi:hypothetical protein
MGNKDIADFMGWDIKDPMSLPTSIQQPVYDNCWFYKFDKSWDWLMPVVEKIYSIDADVDFFKNISLEDTYQAVLEFIKKFNNKKNGK